MMNGNSYNITRAEGGFIVHVNKRAEQSSEVGSFMTPYEARVFTDSSALLNYFHNELMRSN